MPQTIDMRGILLANSSSPKRASNYRLGNRPGSSALQLAAGHFQSVTAMTLVYPRPDTETHSKARHRVNYTGQTYRIPIGVHGGAFPYNFALTNAPSGMTVGQSLTLVSGNYVRGADYGIINWPNSVAGTYTPTLTVTDQLGNTASVTWTIVVGTSGWNVVDSTAATNGTGTLASPYNTLASVTNGNPLLLRAGTYDMNQVQIKLETASRVWLPYGAEDVVLQQATYTISNNAGTGDIWFSKCRFVVTAPRNTVNNFFRFEGLSRSVFFETTFDYNGMTYTTTGGTENVACLMWVNMGLAESDVGNGWYNLLHSNTYRGVSDRDFLIAYSMRFAVIENNALEDCDTGAGGRGHGFYIKANCSDIDIKCNYSIGTSNTQKLARIDAYELQFQVNRIQISYNSYRYYGTDEGAIGFCHEWVASGDDRWAFRNSLYAHTTAAFYLRGMAAGDTVTLTNNVMVSGGTNTNGARLDEFQATLVNTGYVAGNVAAGILDANNALAGGFVSNLGTKGAQVA